MLTSCSRPLVTAALVILFYITAFAQPQFNSPYSRFGLGDPVPQYFANQAAQGGQSIAFHDPFHLNFLNPASFAFLRATALEVGLNATRSNYEFMDESTSDWAGNLAYLALGFTLKSPINEALDRIRSPWQAGMGVSLSPVYQVGYNLISSGTSTGTDTVLNTFQGSGGAYQFKWSNGVKYKNTAFGVTLGWIFGESRYENGTVFNDSLTGFENIFRDEIRLNGFVWNVGLQHDFVLRYAPNNRDVPTRWITLGLTAESSHGVNAYVDRLYFRRRPGTGDTIQALFDQQFGLTLPGAAGIGIQYVEANRLRLGAEFRYEFDEQYKNEIRPQEQYVNTLSVSAGFEFTPNANSYNRYLKRVAYRLGAYYRQDPRNFSGEPLDDYGLSFGFGLPIVLPRQQTSFVNTAFEIGQFGGNSSLKETYFRITVGFTLNDNSWFYKRRFE